TPAHGRGGTYANRAAPAAQNLPPRFPARKVRASQAGKTARHGDIACGPSMAGKFAHAVTPSPERVVNAPQPPSHVASWRLLAQPTHGVLSVNQGRRMVERQRSPSGPFRQARTMVGFAALNPPYVLS